MYSRYLKQKVLVILDKATIEFIKTNMRFFVKKNHSFYTYANSFYQILKYANSKVYENMFLPIQLYTQGKRTST